jgi:hypothetical protein
MILARGALAWYLAEGWDWTQRRLRRASASVRIASKAKPMCGRALT